MIEILTYLINQLYRWPLVICLVLLSLPASAAFMPVNPVGIAGFDPVITIENPYNTGIFSAEEGEEDIQYYFVKGSGFRIGQTVTIALNAAEPFTISATGDDFSATAEIEVSAEGDFDRMIALRYAPTDSGPHRAAITHSGDGAETKTLELDGNIAPLPVELVSFNGQAEENSIVLNWSTASEKNNSHFDVELSQNPAAGFRKVGSVNSQEQNSINASHYTYAHHMSSADGKYYFRLKQVDVDHTASYSKVIVVDMAASEVATVKVAPNPVSTSAQLSLSTSAPGKLTVVIFQMDGAIIYQRSYNIREGEHTFPLDLEKQLKTGMYILTTEFKGRTHRLKLIKI